MKVALVIEHFDALRGGAERVTVWLAGELAKQGVEVHVVCHDARARYHERRSAHQGASHDAQLSARAHAPAEEPPPDGVTVHRLPGTKLSTGLGFRRFGKRVEKWCRVHKPDVVHSASVAFAGDIYHSAAGVYAGIQQAAVASRVTKSSAAWKQVLLKLSGKARTLLDLETTATAPYLPQRGKAKRHGAWRLICISPMIWEEYQKYYGVAAEQMVMLENPRLDPLPDLSRLPELRQEFRSHYGLSPEARVAVFVGHDFRRKGLRWAIEALAQAREPWHLLVVGLGKAREYIDLVKARGLEGRVKFVGPTKQMAQVYAASDALLFPTFYDSFGLVAVEALSYGLPVISTRTLGCYRIISENQVGTIVESPRDVTGMAQALDQLPPLHDAAYATLAVRARTVAAGTLSPEDFMVRLLKLYAECCSEKKAR